MPLFIRFLPTAIIHLVKQFRGSDMWIAVFLVRLQHPEKIQPGVLTVVLAVDFNLVGRIGGHGFGQISLNIAQ